MQFDFFQVQGRLEMPIQMENFWPISRLEGENPVLELTVQKHLIYLHI